MQGARTLTLCWGKLQPLTVTPRAVAGASRQPQRGKENRSWVLGLLQTLKTTLPAQGVRELSVVHKYRMPWGGLGEVELHRRERRKVPESAETAGFPRDAGFELVDAKDRFDTAVSNSDDGHLERGYQASHRTRVLPS